MGKTIGTTGIITFGGTDYGAIEITANFDVEQADVTDGQTSGDGREYLAGRVARELSCKLWVDDATAEPSEGATGALTWTVVPAGSTAKSYAWTNATIVNKSMNHNPAGSEGFSATYTFRLDGATTAAQYTA